MTTRLSRRQSPICVVVLGESRSLKAYRELSMQMQVPLGRVACNATA